MRGPSIDLDHVSKWLRMRVRRAPPRQGPDIRPFFHPMRWRRRDSGEPPVQLLSLQQLDEGVARQFQFQVPTDPLSGPWPQHP